MKPASLSPAALLCQKLVRCKSLSGEEQEAAKLLEKSMRDLGFDEVTVDRYGNVIGTITGNLTGSKPGPCILFDGHIDTVPVPDPDEWTMSPFDGFVKDGKIYGRGTSDMKGAVAAMAVAAADFAKECGKDFAGRICVAGVVHEECFEGIASREISKTYKPDYVVIGEASELNLKIGQRGRAEITVETFGKPAHSAHPELGINAIYMMTRLVELLRGNEESEHPVLGQGICVATDIISTPYPGASVVPSRCRATYDRRLLVGETEETVLAPFQQAMDTLKEENIAFKGSVQFAKGCETCYTGETISGTRFFPAWLYDAESPFVLAALSELHAAGLTDTGVSHYSFCTNGSHYAGELGIPTLGYGPSQENLAHTIDEYIELDQLDKAVTGYKAIIKGLLTLQK